jgi:hypothetical protein
MKIAIFYLIYVKNDLREAFTDSVALTLDGKMPSHREAKQMVEAYLTQQKTEFDHILITSIQKFSDEDAESLVGA